MPETQGEHSPDTMNGEVLDFALNIYRGCVLPEDYRPIRATSWTQWLADNPEDYTPEQLGLIKLKLLSGKSWVCFCGSLETISAADYYKPQPQYRNPVQPKVKLI